MKDKENEIITDYIHRILLPLEQFYTSRYHLVQNGSHQEKEIMKKVHMLYLEKLEQFTLLIEDIEKERK